MNGHFINHVMNADDLILISPSSAELCKWLCEYQKLEKVIVLNIMQMLANMIFKSKILKERYVFDCKQYMVIGVLFIYYTYGPKIHAQDVCVLC